MCLADHFSSFPPRAWVRDDVPVRLFVDKSARPDDTSVRAWLASGAGPYDDLLRLVGRASRTWVYSAGSGWLLKVHDREKALLYVVPYEGMFRVRLTVRDAERAEMPSSARSTPGRMGSRDV